MHRALPAHDSSPAQVLVFEQAYHDVLAETPALPARSFSRLPRLAAPPLGRRPEFTPPTELLSLERAQAPSRRPVVA